MIAKLRRNKNVSHSSNFDGNESNASIQFYCFRINKRGAWAVLFYSSWKARSIKTIVDSYNLSLTQKKRIEWENETCLMEAKKKKHLREGKKVHILLIARVPKSPYLRANGINNGNGPSKREIRLPTEIANFGYFFTSFIIPHFNSTSAKMFLFETHFVLVILLSFFCTANTYFNYNIKMMLCYQHTINMTSLFFPLDFFFALWLW